MAPRTLTTPAEVRIVAHDGGLEVAQRQAHVADLTQRFRPPQQGFVRDVAVLQ